MGSLLEEMFEAHAVLERCRRFSKADAEAVAADRLLSLKGPMRDHGTRE